MSVESGAKARILVVDDSKLMRKAAHKMLGDEFDVITGEDGEDAWNQIGNDTSIQVVFTDLNMPKVDGYELLRRVRASDDSGVQSLPVIVVTGAENDEAARMQALDLGATDFITKPFTTTDLVARARAHANNQRITKQLQAQSTLDALTGLSNKAGFMERLQQDIAYARRHEQPLCLVRLEMEDFRRFFLYYGRDVAESLVLQVARLLRSRIRKEDTAARIGLGGFALSLPGGDAQGIEGMIARLRLEMAAQPPTDEDGQPIAVVLSSGVLSPELSQGPSAQALFEQCQALLAVPPVAAPAAPAEPPVLQMAASIVPLAPAPASAPPAFDHAAAEAAMAAETAAPVPAVHPAESAPVAARFDVPVSPTPTPTPVPATTPTPTPATAPAPATAAPAPSAPAPAPAAAAAAEPLRLDPLLDEIARGNPQPAAEKLPLVIGRLLPLFRLLGPNQRAQLIQFLQRLG